MANGNDHTGLDYVHPTAITAWQLIGTVTGVFVIIVIAAWTIITNEAHNNQLITDELKNYVTKSNHDDLVNRFNDFRTDTKHDIAKMMPRQAFDDFLKERNKLIDRMQEQITGAVTKVEQGLRETASKDTIANLQAQIAQIRDDMQRYATKEQMSSHGAADVERVKSLQREVDTLRSELKDGRKP